MNNATENITICVLGIDLAKNSFQLHGVDRHGEQVYKKWHGSNPVNTFKICKAALPTLID